ncbi:hypothetical protein ACIPY6_41830 [Streptomyces sp. NPDC090054]|uniref:hypothetical protein n=1 Tax=Streptomyces sp. NPDC090054 TaxID=3365933 RepID=UPI003802F398
MTASPWEGIHRAAAEAALGVPGVDALQPALSGRLALAASRARHAMTPSTTPPREVAGIRCERTPDGGCHVEVRCILHTDRRIVDIARQVRNEVKDAVTARLAQHRTIIPVLVTVTITRTL